MFRAVISKAVGTRLLRLSKFYRLDLGVLLDEVLREEEQERLLVIVINLVGFDSLDCGDHSLDERMLIVIVHHSQLL